MVKKVIHIADIHIRTFRMHDVYGEVFKQFLKEIRELVKDYDRETPVDYTVQKAEP